MRHKQESPEMRVSTEELPKSHWPVDLAGVGVSWLLIYVGGLGSLLEASFIGRWYWTAWESYGKQYSPRVLLYIFGLVGGNAVWNSKQTYFQVPVLNSCLGVLQWCIVTWNCCFWSHYFITACIKIELIYGWEWVWRWSIIHSLVAPKMALAEDRSTCV